jgi:multicomponent Na+:H+ antiporter subunit A
MNSETFDIPAIAALLPGDALPALLLIAFLGAALGFLTLARVGAWAGPLAAVLPAGLFAAFVGYVPILSAGEGVPTIVQTVSWVPSLGINFDIQA